MNDTAKISGSGEVTFSGSEWRAGQLTFFSGSCPGAEIDGVKIAAQLESASASALEFSFPGTGLRWNWIKLRWTGQSICCFSRQRRSEKEPNAVPCFFPKKTFRRSMPFIITAVTRKELSSIAEG